MISPWLIYVWGIADDVRAALTGMMFTSIVAALAIGIPGFIAKIESELSKETMALGVKWITRAVICAAVCGLLSTFIPSSKTIAVMVIAPAIVNSKPVQQDLPELYSIAIEAIKESFKPSKGNQ